MSTRRLTLPLGVLAAALVLAAPAAACEGASVTPTAERLGKARKATLCLLNVQRRAHGLSALRGNRRLRRAATRHSNAMVRLRFFDHTSPEGSTLVARVSRAGYTPWASLGENIAWGSGALATPRAIVRGWMRSPGHRANILRGRFRHVGIGIAAGAPVALHPGELGATYTTDFGVRR